MSRTSLCAGPSHIPEGTAALIQKSLERKLLNEQERRVDAEERVKMQEERADRQQFRANRLEEEIAALEKQVLGLWGFLDEAQRVNVESERSRRQKEDIKDLDVLLMNLEKSGSTIIPWRRKIPALANIKEAPARDNEPLQSETLQQDWERGSRANKKQRKKKGQAQKHLQNLFREEMEQKDHHLVAKLENQKKKADSRIHQLASENKRLSSSAEYYKKYCKRESPSTAGLLARRVIDRDPARTEIERLRLVIDEQDKTIAEYTKAEAAYKDIISQLAPDQNYNSPEPEPKPTEESQRPMMDDELSFYDQKWIRRRGKWVPQ